MTWKLRNEQNYESFSIEYSCCLFHLSNTKSLVRQDDWETTLNIQQQTVHFRTHKKRIWNTNEFHNVGFVERKNFKCDSCNEKNSICCKFSSVLSIVWYKMKVSLLSIAFLLPRFRSYFALIQPAHKFSMHIVYVALMIHANKKKRV